MIYLFYIVSEIYFEPFANKSSTQGDIDIILILKY